MNDKPKEAPTSPTKRLSGAQRRKDTRTRILRDGIWRLDVWQPHDRVKRGKGMHAQNH